jgi:hypothetical protein
MDGFMACPEGRHGADLADRNHQHSYLIPLN